MWAPRTVWGRRGLGHMCSTNRQPWTGGHVTDRIEASSLCSSLAVQRWPHHPTSLILGFLTHNTGFRYLVI